MSDEKAWLAVSTLSYTKDGLSSNLLIHDFTDLTFSHVRTVRYHLQNAPRGGMKLSKMFYADASRVPPT